jgi:hypothetical protein
MLLEDVWFSQNEFDRKLNYLLHSFNRIDIDLFSSFSILPLRDQNLTVSSMFYADICLRMYPLLTIGFSTLTFGNWMEEKLTHWIKAKNERHSNDYISKLDLDGITQEIYLLHIKRSKKEDTIRDYYKFYSNEELGIKMYFDLNGSVSPIQRIGRVELAEVVTPFDASVFNKYLETRNEIEHRGGVEATLKQAFWAFSALFLIIQNSIYHSSQCNIDSRIFELPNKSLYR